jgi:hypothetical protein
MKIAFLTKLICKFFISLCFQMEAKILFQARQERGALQNAPSGHVITRTLLSLGHGMVPHLWMEGLSIHLLEALNPGRRDNRASSVCGQCA